MLFQSENNRKTNHLINHQPSIVWITLHVFYNILYFAISIVTRTKFALLLLTLFYYIILLLMVLMYFIYLLQVVHTYIIQFYFLGIFFAIVSSKF
jgi:hypothetical protein